jgi:nucleoside-diphosphate-sugar epimerase
MARVLVTGAGGFVGGHLVDYLQRQGHQVIAGLRQASGSTMSGAEVVGLGDVSSTPWERVLPGVEVVVHLAALAHQIGPRGETRESEFMRINAEGTARLAKTIATVPTVRRLIFMSSVAVVGGADGRTLDDSTRCEPVTVYGKSKLAAEKAIREALPAGTPDWCVLRPPLIYGPGNPGNMARLLRLVRTGLPLPLGGLRGQRSFLFVGNLVALIERVLTAPEASRQAFLVDDGAPVSTRELVVKLAEMEGRLVRLVNVPPTVLKGAGVLGDAVQKLARRSVGVDSYSVERLLGSLVVDSSRVRRVLGWSPPFAFEEGMRLTLHGDPS